MSHHYYRKLHLPGAALFVTLLTLVCWDCTGNEDNTDDIAVPRPTAYPRIITYPATYTDIALPAVTVAVNDSAKVKQEIKQADDIQWIGINYPRYHATIYCTYTPITASTTVAQILSNREERMALNSGGATSELTEFVNQEGISCQMLVTPYGTITPVQFIATDSTRFVLSGTLQMQDLTEASNNDSISPIVKAVETDVLHLLKNMVTK